MATAAETSKASRDSGAESPTTARPFEIDEDDDDAQETGVISAENLIKPSSTTAAASDTGSTAAPPFTATSNTTITEEETPPAKPPRPMTEAQKNEAILKEAFPAVEAGVIKAILRASGGRIEPAFNALLEMTDPDATRNEPEPVPPPPQPPRPQGRQLSQMEADERYARQLAEQYDNVGAYEHRTSSQRGNAKPQRPPLVDDDGREHSFIDDDLPVIRENLRKGFMETQTKVNSWINTLKKRIEENFDENDDHHNRYGDQHDQYGRQGETSRRSGDYDADPQVLSDDFAGMKFTADGTPARRATSRTANPSSLNTNAYRPPSTSPRPSANGRRVGFKEETEEIGLYDASPKVPPKGNPSASTKNSKWQPLSAVEPNPIADNDPFSLGDSEDEKEPKDAHEAKDKPKDASQDDKLKQATADAMADSLVESSQAADSSTKKT